MVSSRSLADTARMPKEGSGPHPIRRATAARAPRRSASFTSLAVGFVLALAASQVAAQEGQTFSFPFGAGFLGPLPLDQTGLAGEVSIGVADLAQASGSLEATLWAGQGYAFDQATAPGFAIFDRTLLIGSSLDPFEGRYQIQFGIRRLRDGLRTLDDFARARFVQYGDLATERIRYARIRSDLRRSLTRARVLDPRTGEIRFGRFARSLRILRYDKPEARWRPARDAVAGRAEIRFLPGRRADFTLGHHGVDLQNDLVWTVQGDGGAYALGFEIVPEPGTFGMFVTGALLLGCLEASRRGR